MNETRLAFLAAAGTARPIVSLAEVGEKWDEPSALAQMTIGDLAAHLVRAVTTVNNYLQKPVRHAEEPLSAAAYYAAMIKTNDLNAPANVGIRERAHEMSKQGHRAIVELMDSNLEAVKQRLAHESPDLLIEVINEYVLPLDEYLITRIVELLVHTDDLCVSLGRSTPALAGADVAIKCLIDVAEVRHGELAVLRALSRRERDPDNVLRVL